MTIFERPYFMQNEDWYYFDEDECQYKLTDVAPEKAKQSYIAFYEQLEKRYMCDE